MIFYHLLIFQNSKKKIFEEYQPSVSNRLDPEQDPYFVRPDLGHKCLQVISGQNWQINLMHTEVNKKLKIKPLILQRKYPQLICCLKH